MTNFNFIATGHVFMQPVNGNTVNINTNDFTSIDVDILSNLEINALKYGVDFGYIICADPDGFAEFAAASARTITNVANQTAITNGDGAGGKPTVGIADNVVLPGTGSMTVVSGTTGQRDTPTNGQLRFNSTLADLEFSSGNVYRPVGKVVQFLTGDITQTSGNTQLPYDNTIPLSTEGFQIWTQSITPLYNNSKIVVIFNIHAESSVAGNATTLALFNGTTAIAAAAGMMVTTTNSPFGLGITKQFTSGTTSAITLSARIGGNAASTIYVNRGNTETFGGTTSTSYIIMEII